MPRGEHHAEIAVAVRRGYLFVEHNEVVFVESQLRPIFTLHEKISPEFAEEGVIEVVTYDEVNLIAGFIQYPRFNMNEAHLSKQSHHKLFEQPPLFYRVRLVFSFGEKVFQNLNGESVDVLIVLSIDDLSELRNPFS